jgi:hypothetical protein
MGAKLDVYSLGQVGVNRTRSPIQVKDGELLQSQNATVRPVRAQLALTKRDGMAKINSSQAPGSILSITNLPFVDPGSGAAEFAFYIATNTNPLFGWMYTEDGTTFQEITTGEDVQNANANGKVNQSLGPDDLLYFISLNTDTVWSWDGTTPTELAGAPAEVVTYIHYDSVDDRLYAGAEAGASDKVFYWDGASWTIVDDTGLAAGFNGNLATANGDLFGMNATGGDVYIFDGVSSWSIDLDVSVTVTANAVRTDFCRALNTTDLMWFGNDDVTNQLLVWKRNSSGVWSDVTPAGYGDSIVNNGFAIDGTIYISIFNLGTSDMFVLSYDGTSWTELADVVANIDAGAFDVNYLYVWDDKLYVTMGSNTQGGTNTVGFTELSAISWSLIPACDGYFFSEGPLIP